MPNISIALTCFILLVSMACGSADGNESHSAAADAKSKDSKLVPDGMAVFRQKCITCHGADGTLGLNGAKDLTQCALSFEERVNIITNGKKLMTPFGTVLSPEEIQAVAEYTMTFKK